ncbi:MAG: hypothetical protein N2688_08690 [Burkholderiaceae bacterium]|nr:hypothetical protein [Burkholderiaceae bacterium]
MAAAQVVAALLPEQEAPPLAAWLPASGWQGAALLRVHGEEVQVLARAGDIRLPAEPTPALLDAYRAPQWWAADGRVTVACVRMAQEGLPSLVLLQRAEERRTAWPLWGALAAGTLLLGGALGWYLVARVYRPVQWMEQALAAAAAGRALPPDEVSSEETASLRSSLALLLARRGEAGNGDAPPSRA